MDPFNLAFYALVCGTLAGVSSRLGAWWLRACLGGVVGLVAAAALPQLRALLGVG